MKEISDWMSVGIALIGYLFIVIKSCAWVVGLIAKQWLKSRKEGLQQKAVNDLYDAFELDDLKEGSTMRVATKANLNIVMYRSSTTAPKPEREA